MFYNDNYGGISFQLFETIKQREKQTSDSPQVFLAIMVTRCLAELWMEPLRNYTGSSLYSNVLKLSFELFFIITLSTEEHNLLTYTSAIYRIGATKLADVPPSLSSKAREALCHICWGWEGGGLLTWHFGGIMKPL